MSEDESVSVSVSEESVSALEIDHYQSTSSSGHDADGIEIDIARESLQASDRMDRTRERERIRAIHRERKRKSHTLRKEGSQSQAILRVPFEDSDSDGSRCEADEVTLDEPIKKRVKVNNERKRKKGFGEEQLGTEAPPVALCEDEELALHLLIS